VDQGDKQAALIFAAISKGLVGKKRGADGNEQAGVFVDAGSSVFVELNEVAGKILAAEFEIGFSIENLLEGRNGLFTFEIEPLRQFRESPIEPDDPVVGIAGDHLPEGLLLLEAEEAVSVDAVQFRGAFDDEGKQMGGYGWNMD